MYAFAAHVYGVSALANKQPKKTLLCALALKTYACSTVRFGGDFVRRLVKTLDEDQHTS